MTRTRFKGVLTFAQMDAMSSAALLAARADGWVPQIGGGDYGADTALRTKLKDIENEIGRLVVTKSEKQKALDEAKAAWAQSPDNDVNSDVFKAAETARGDWGKVEDQIVDLTNVQIATLKMIGSDSDNNKVDTGSGSRSKADEYEDWDSSKVLTDELTNRLKSFANSSGRFGSIDLGQVASRKALRHSLKAAGDLDSTAGLRRGPSYGVVGAAYRPLRVLDLVPVGTMDGNSLPYTQEGGTFGAAPTAEGVRKPGGGMTLTDANANAETIAVWQKIKKPALSDTAALQSIIDQRLRYAVRLALEGQVIAGDGVSPNLSGIRTQAGIGKVTWASMAATVPLADRILAGIVQVMLGNGEANGVAINPTEWQGILTAKETTSGAYLQGGPFSPVASTVWGVPMLPTPAMQAGFSLVGDWSQGAQVFVREGVNVLISDSDATDFTENRVTILAEGRFALAVWRPAVFSEVDLAA
jgi:hypothetical protein